MAEANDKIACEICGALTHSIQIHLRDNHPEVSVDQYREKFPGKPLLSKKAEEELKRRMEGKKAAPVAPAKEAVESFFHDVFGLNGIPAALSAKGNPIKITVLPDDPDWSSMVPKIDPNYVFDVENAKNLILGLELNIPIYAWGHFGTGKTTLLEQVCARTKRPLLRVQHTINTEEPHVIGQYVLVGGETKFQPGPLAMAMRFGWTYLADEYDFGLPSVLALYQPVLEGKSLVIKDAPPDWRVVKPHPNFRFMASGNTNGGGDDTGLYQGTAAQNAANYDRFGVCIQVKYMAPEVEAAVIMGQAGIPKSDAAKLVDFANRVREAYGAGQITTTISPRTLINAAKLGFCRGSWRAGITLSFINKLSPVDREAVEGVASRVFS